MKDQKRNLASIIVSKMTKPKSEEQPKDSDNYDSLQAGAEEVLMAIEAKDATQLKDALKAMIQMCMDSYEAEEEALEDSPKLGE